MSCKFIVKVRGDHYTDYYLKIGRFSRLILVRADAGYDVRT